jgi:transmembrane sensor
MPARKTSAPPSPLPSVPRRDWVAQLFRFRGTTRARILLAVLLAAGLAAMVFLHPFRKTADYETAANETREIIWEDGASMHLSGGTDLTVITDLMEKRVLIRQGEAEFSLPRRPWRPFFVATTRLAVRGSGGHFVLRVEPERTDLDLIAGTVDLTDPVRHQPVTAPQPGQGLSVGDDGPDAPANRPAPVTVLPVQPPTR